MLLATGDQLFRVNGKLLPALIDKQKLTLLLAQQCFEFDTISLSFRTDALDEYTSVIHLDDSHSQGPYDGSNQLTSNRKLGKSLSVSPGAGRNSSIADSWAHSPPPDREPASYLPIGLTPTDPRWESFGSPDKQQTNTSLTEFLHEMRLELKKVQELAQKKVGEAEKRR
jgi:hypothetical protein